MKKINYLYSILFLAFTACSQSSSIQISEEGTKWNWNKGTIVVETPERPAGQESVIGMALPKM